jgi:hypothetical protein
MTDNIQNTTAVSGMFNYEKDNFFDSPTDNLVDMKNIMGHQHFWERIEVFFALKVVHDV